MSKLENTLKSSNISYLETGTDKENINENENTNKMTKDKSNNLYINNSIKRYHHIDKMEKIDINNKTDNNVINNIDVINLGKFEENPSILDNNNLNKHENNNDILNKKLVISNKWKDTINEELKKMKVKIETKDNRISNSKLLKLNDKKCFKIVQENENLNKKLIRTKPFLGKDILNYVNDKTKCNNVNEDNTIEYKNTKNTLNDNQLNPLSMSNLINNDTVNEKNQIYRSLPNITIEIFVDKTKENYKRIILKNDLEKEESDENKNRKSRRGRIKKNTSKLVKENDGIKTYDESEKNDIEILDLTIDENINDKKEIQKSKKSRKRKNRLLKNHNEIQVVNEKNEKNINIPDVFIIDNDKKNHKSKKEIKRKNLTSIKNKLLKGDTNIKAIDRKNKENNNIPDINIIDDKNDERNNKISKKGKKRKNYLVINLEDNDDLSQIVMNDKKNNDKCNCEKEMYNKIEKRIKCNSEKEINNEGEDRIKCDGEKEVNNEGEDRIKCDNGKGINKKSEDRKKYDNEKEINNKHEDQIKCDNEKKMNNEGEDQTKCDDEKEINNKSEDQIKCDDEKEINSKSENRTKYDEEEEMNNKNENRMNCDDEKEVNNKSEDQIKYDEGGKNNKSENRTKCNDEQEMNSKNENRTKCDNEKEVNNKSENQTKCNDEKEMNNISENRTLRRSRRIQKKIENLKIKNEKEESMIFKKNSRLIHKYSSNKKVIEGTTSQTRKEIMNKRNIKKGIKKFNVKPSKSSKTFKKVKTENCYQLRSFSSKLIQKKEFKKAMVKSESLVRKIVKDPIDKKILQRTKILNNHINNTSKDKIKNIFIELLLALDEGNKNRNNNNNNYKIKNGNISETDNINEVFERDKKNIKNIIDDNQIIEDCLYDFISKSKTHGLKSYMDIINILKDPLKYYPYHKLEKNKYYYTCLDTPLSTRKEYLEYGLYSEDSRVGIKRRKITSSSSSQSHNNKIFDEIKNFKFPELKHHGEVLINSVKDFQLPIDIYLLSQDPHFKKVIY